MGKLEEAAGGVPKLPDAVVAVNGIPSLPPSAIHPQKMFAETSIQPKLLLH